MVKNVFLLENLSRLNAAAKWLLEEVGEYRIIAFYGELGAGKTTFIRELCRLMGVRQEVTSPTFSIVNEYSGENNQSIYHFDFYRFNRPEEALDIGFEDYITSEFPCLMEWPEKIEAFLPPETLRVYIDVTENNSRTISLVFPA